MSVLDFLTSLLAPDDCLGCGREGALLCRDCYRLLPPPPGRCFGCYAVVTKQVACASCLRSASITDLRVACNYQAAAKQLVLHIKFAGSQSAARHMAALLPLPSDWPTTAIVTHIPATAEHIRARGYDQAQLIARQFARRSHLSYGSLLARSGRQHQLGATRQTRRQQLSSSLRVRHSGRLRGQHIILIDDVLTTGASLTAAAQVLLAAGAARVYACAFAQSNKR